MGLTDPNGNLSRRLHTMGMTLVVVVFMGALLPGLVWRYPWVNFVVAFVVAFATGLSPLLGSPSLFTATKLGTALFAINITVNQKTNGYGGIKVSVGWTFIGGAISLLAALLPEMIGTRDAVRTDLFKVYHGFGTSLQQWSATWGTGKQTSSAPVPFVTLSIAKMQDNIFCDDTEDPNARKWLLGIIGKADNIRAASQCLSNGYEMAKPYFESSAVDKHQEIDDLFLALGCACRWIARHLEFPWALQHSPCLNQRLQDSVRDVGMAVSALKMRIKDPDLMLNNNQTKFMLFSLPVLADLLEIEVRDVANRVLDTKQWPSYSSTKTLPRRVAAAFPAMLCPIVDRDASWAIRGYAVRFAIAFSLASIPELVMPGTSAHWFPMTVAFIMGPTYSATFRAVAHRTVGTLLGIALGSALIPLFDYPTVLIILLGLNTYAACVFFQASYVLFTVFITAWVMCTSIGVGASVGRTIMYRCVWTLAASLMVTIVSHVYPPKNEYEVTQKLAGMAKATKDYASAVIEEHQLRYINGEDENGKAQLEEAHLAVKQTRKAALKARIAMLTCINEAALTPNEPGLLLDPHSAAPMLASNLIDALVVPMAVSLLGGNCEQAVSLLGDNCDDYILAGIDEESFAEVDRLVARLELHALSPLKRRQTLLSPLKNIKPSSQLRESVGHEMKPPKLSPFANAISSCMQRLDDAGVPRT